MRLNVAVQIFFVTGLFCHLDNWSLSSFIFPCSLCHPLSAQRHVYVTLSQPSVMSMSPSLSPASCLCHPLSAQRQVYVTLSQPSVMSMSPSLSPASCQNSIDTGIIPDDWLTANVVGIYKKGDKQEPANYRPVSLTSVMCKVLEHIIYSQIMSHYNKHNFLSEYQHGFRRGYSCETQLLATVEDIQRGIDSSSNS